MLFSFFAGKGGVGKTTCAAAEAVLFAARGRRVLAVSTDPAHSLGDALGERLSARPRRVHRGLFAAELDADRALSRWFQKRERAFRVLASRGTYLDDEDVDQLLSQSLPGVDELIGLVELTRLAAAGEYDRVVVDTAPTGHTLRLLAMPDTLARLARVLNDLQQKHRWMSQSLGGRYLPDASDAVIEGLERQAEELRALLRDPARSAFHWVMLPEELALREARDGVAGLQRLGVRVRELVVNRLTPAPRSPCALCAGRRAEEARVLRATREAFSDTPLRLVRALDEEPRGLAALRRLSSARTQAPRPGAARPQPGEGTAWVPPEGVRLLLFGGKGGVGKTTCAAACALHLARRGKRVLLLSTDPAHSLGDVLDRALSDEPRDIAERLTARELDADRAFAARREQYRRSVDELFDALRGGARFDATFDRQVVQDLIDLAPPGIDELFALFAVVEALQAGFETVVVDTAPTGHALRLLEMPEKALGWVHALLAILLKYRRVIGLGDLARTLTTTARELRDLQELLRDPARALFVPVTRAAVLPRMETERLLRALRRLGIPTGPVLVNALTPAGCGRCGRAAAVEAGEVAALRRRTPAMLATPAVAPPPRGARQLLAFGRTWASR
ncbi:MAG TPA: TRC40/GET3/ArsA family transport-energizing ATPase [Myxococcales bacterium]|nr:TRC40/GET3/ArsA family transport-energizing ATPase [Myxococcales bacterium]